MPRNTEERHLLKVQNFVALLLYHLIQTTAFLETERLPMPFWGIKFSVEYA